MFYVVNTRAGNCKHTVNKFTFFGFSWLVEAIKKGVCRDGKLLQDQRLR